MNKQQTDLFIKIIIIVLVIWFIKDFFLSSSSCSVVERSTFFVSQEDRDLMKKNVVYVYTRNPFLDESYKNLNLETLRNIDDPTDRTKFSDLMTNYYNVQNQHFHIIDDISNVVKQLRNLYGINDIQLHSSATNVLDFSNNIAYSQILNELSSTTTANTKSTFASTYDTNIAAYISITSSNTQTIRSATFDKTTSKVIPTIESIKFSYDPNVKPEMLIINKGNFLNAGDKNYYRIVSVTRTSNDTMTLEIENTTSDYVFFNTLGNYQVIKRMGPPVLALTEFLYDQTIREDEIVIVYNNKMVSFNTESFDPTIFLIQYNKKKPLDFEIPPYQNFRREQIMQLLYKNHF
jgi:hypothetical protein